jgi:hypothetical protein
MSNAVVRKYFTYLILVIILLGTILQAGCQPVEGINISWDFSYLLSHCNVPALVEPALVEPATPVEGSPFTFYFPPAFFSTFPFSVGEFIDLLLQDLTSPESEITCSDLPNDIVLYMSDSKGTRVIPNDSTLTFLADATEDTLLFFGPSQKSDEFVRLTLFGYVMDGNSSCVLWSLDGTPNLRANEKCGGEVDLVCTVKLVEKNLKYNCKDGYDWLGFNIIHDSHWLSWADQFASKNGNK